MARQVTMHTKEQVSVVAIDKLKQLKRKYKHPDIRRGEYSIGTTRERNRQNELLITLELHDEGTFIPIGYLDVKKLEVRPHKTLSSMGNPDQSKSKNAFRRQVFKTLAELNSYLVKHYREEKPKKTKRLNKNVVESKWIRWRDYA